METTVNPELESREEKLNRLVGEIFRVAKTYAMSRYELLELQSEEEDARIERNIQRFQRLGLKTDIDYGFTAHLREYDALLGERLYIGLDVSKQDTPVRAVSYSIDRGIPSRIPGYNIVDRFKINTGSVIKDYGHTISDKYETIIAENITVEGESRYMFEAGIGEKRQDGSIKALERILARLIAGGQSGAESVVQGEQLREEGDLPDLAVTQGVHRTEVARSIADSDYSGGEQHYRGRTPRVERLLASRSMGC